MYILRLCSSLLYRYEGWSEEEAGVGKLDPTNYRRRCQDQEGKQGHSEKLMQILRGSRLSLEASFITALSVGGETSELVPFP